MMPQANGASRYGTPPPAILSPDLTAPWVMQLRVKPSAKPFWDIRRQRKAFRNNSYQTTISTPRVRSRSIFQPTGLRMKKQRSRSGLQTNYPRTVINSAPKPQRGALQRNSVINPANRPEKMQRSAVQINPKFEPQLVSYTGQNFCWHDNYRYQ